MIAPKRPPPPEPIKIEIAADGDITLTVPAGYEYWRLEFACKRLSEAAEQLQQAAATAHKKATAALVARQVELGLLPPGKGR